MPFPSPGKKPIIIFTLSEGLELLLPRPQKKTEPSEEQKGEPALKGTLLLLRGALAAGMGAGLRAPCSSPWWEVCAVVFLRFRSEWGEEALAQRVCPAGQVGGPRGVHLLQNHTITGCGSP